MLSLFCFLEMNAIMEKDIEDNKCVKNTSKGNKTFFIFLT